MARSKKRYARRGIAGVVTLLALAIITADRWLPRTPSKPKASPSDQSLAFDKPFEVTVLKVTDGDTIVVTGNQRVRLIGVDTIESRRGKRLEGQAGRLGMNSERALKWGNKASEFARIRLLNATVELRPGYERFDKYGRLLAYVWYQPNADAEPLCFNRILIEEGLALATRSFEHPAKEEYLKLEADARARKRGLWAYATK